MSSKNLLALLALLSVGACDGGATTDKTDTDTTETDSDTTTETDTETDTTPVADICTDYPGNVTCSGTNAVLSGTFTSDIRLTDDYDYVLDGQVEIGGEGTETAEPTDTAVLTIDAGVTIYGTAQSFLAINRGSQIFANGTASAPVVFTSERVALGENAAAGDWGGIVINGRAPVNSCATPGCTVAGEAGTGLFGGDMPTDNSGKLSYVRVEFGGFDVLPDEELNGITFAGVGSGTQIDHIQVHANDDDGIEFFGGTADAKYIVISCVKDDGLDTDLGYQGSIQHLLVVQCADFSETSNPSGSENDNLRADNSATPVSTPIVSNATFIGRPAQSSPAYGLVFRRGTAFQLHNSIVTGFATGCLAIRDAASAPVIRNSIFSCSQTFELEEGGNTTEEEDVFNATGANNSTSDPMLTQTSVTLDSTPDFRPMAGSPAASGAVQPNGAFFDAETHIGAFAAGGDNWLSGWTAFPAN